VRKLKVSRIGYLPYRGPFKGEVVLMSSPIQLHPVEVKVKAISQDRGGWGFSLRNIRPFQAQHKGV
jgi:hypothetical protein